MKQTAIDFLESEFNKWAEGRLFIPQHIIEQAKAMEKKEIIEAWNKRGSTIVPKYFLEENINGEQYYNKTYKSE